MITIHNGKMNIPDNDRFVGFAGDNSVNVKQFFLDRPIGEGCVYTLCLRFDDDTVRTLPLDAASDGTGGTVLTWNVRREELCVNGVVAAQLRIADSDGNITHSTKDYFLVGTAVELDENGADAEYVTCAQLRNSINRALLTVTATAPMIDSDGFWCVYDPQTGAYVRTEYHVSGIVPDSAMSDSSENCVGNKYIKQYVDSKAAACNTLSTGYTDVKTADKVPQTRKIAQLPLSGDISAADLAAQIRPNLYRTNVLPGVSSGVKGELGIGMNSEVFFCTANNEWKQLAENESLYEKMDLITEVSASQMDRVFDGNMFFSEGTLYVKYDDEAISIAKAGDVYSKDEIDTMLGSVESLLSVV